MASFDYDIDTSVIVERIYPLVEKSLDKSFAPFKRVVADFINYNYDQLYAPATYDIIRFRQSDIDKMFKALEIQESDIVEIMKDCWYWDKPLNPQCAKEPYVVTLMMVIRYFIIKNKQKEAELATMYLAFSGKFYASLFGASFPKAYPAKYKEVMDYVVNFMLTDKFSLRKEGTVFGAIRQLCVTYLETYRNDFKDKDLSDDGVKSLVQQLRDREKSFIQNIANLYYKAYDNKLYLQYATDNLEDGAEFRITTNDATTAAKYTESTIQYLTTHEVSLQLCNKCKDQNVKALEIKNIMESIFADNNNLDSVRRVVNILICDYMRHYPGKSISSVEFISHSIKAKPNIKDPYIIEMKETVLKWLDENSEQYRKRKSRLATQMSYYRAVLMYLVLVINKVAT